MDASRRSGIRVPGVLKIAARIAMIFLAIVAVFIFAKGGNEGAVLTAAEEQVIEAPHQPKRAMSALARPAGIPALRR